MRRSSNYNNASQSVTQLTAPAGSFDSTTVGDVFQLGNNFTLSRAWDGKLAEFAAWNRILTPGERVALSLGYSPLMMLPGLRVYVPLADLWRESPTQDKPADRAGIPIGGDASRQNVSRTVAWTPQSVNRARQGRRRISPAQRRVTWRQIIDASVAASRARQRKAV